MPLCKDGLLLVLSIKGELDNAHYTAKNSRLDSGLNARQA